MSNCTLLKRLCVDCDGLIMCCASTYGLGNTEKCNQDDDFIYCYLCYFSFIGKICPCYVAIPKKVQG